MSYVENIENRFPLYLVDLAYGTWYRSGVTSAALDILDTREMLHGIHLDLQNTFLAVQNRSR